MSDTTKINPLVPESKVVSKKRTGFSLVWLIPIIAAAIGAWIAINTIRNQGPVITIMFKSADGLEANKTKIRYNGVEIGEIHTIRLSEDYQSVIATAQMSPKTEEFLAKDTRFWVVRPQISGANVSGLSTIISGAYIGMEIGKSKTSERSYVALPDAPLEAGGITGRFFLLKTPQLGSLNKGTPIFYRRLQAGEVESYELDQSGQFLNVKVFVKAPYDQFVTPATRFWHASGIDLSLSAGGLRVQTESVLSILVGGIAFETPVTGVTLPPAEANTLFELAKDRELAFRPPANNPQRFTLVFKESLRGLAVGAPVELNGITIGEVTAIQAKFENETYEFFAPVTVQVDPARFGVDMLAVPKAGSPEAAAEHRKAMDTLVVRGLRAQLKTGSMISGSRFVALEFFPDAPLVTLDWSQAPVHLPTIPGSLESIENSVVGIIKKLDQVPFGEMGTNLNKTISSLDQTLIGAQGTFTNANQLLKNASTFIAPDSVLDAQINRMLQEVGGAAQAMRVLADYLERHPEALLRGKSGSAK